MRWLTTWWVGWWFASLNGLLYGDAISHPAERIFSLKLLELSWSILIQELVEWEEATTHADLDIVLFDFDGNSLGSELVHTFSFAHEHNLQLLPIRVVVNIFGQLLVNGVSFDWDVDSDTGLKVDNVGAQLFDLVLLVFQLLQHVKLCGLRIVEFLFELNNVRRCTLKLFLQLTLGHLHRIVVSFPRTDLHLNVFLLL